MGALDGKVRGYKTGTGVGTNAGVTVTLAAVTAHYLSPTTVEVSGDAAAVVTIESPSSTVLMTVRYAAAFTDKWKWEAGELQGADGAALLVKISASTAHCEATISAAKLPCAS